MREERTKQERECNRERRGNGNADAICGMENARCNEETAGRPGVVQMSDEARTAGTDGECSVRMNKRGVCVRGRGRGRKEGGEEGRYHLETSQGVCSR